MQITKHTPVPLWRRPLIGLTKRIVPPTVIPLLVLLQSAAVKAQPLATGDFAVVGMNTSLNLVTTLPLGQDEFSIVALATIPSGTTIKITDRAWNGTNLVTANTGDGVMSWTTTAAITAGTVFNIRIATGISPYVTIAPSNCGTPVITDGWTSLSLLGAFANNGDQVLIYQGNDNIPSNFIYGFNTSSSTAAPAGYWQTGSTSARDCDLPPGLLNNPACDGSMTATALAFTNASGFFANNLAYMGPKVGTKAFLLREIGKRSNWDFSITLTLTVDLSLGGSVFPGTNPFFTVHMTLPVNLLGFSGAVTANGHQLLWQSAQEENFREYIIEKSTDGRVFTTVGKQAGKGGGNYAFSVAGVTQERCYYRLKLVDTDNQFTYSRTILLLSNTDNVQLQLYPNPASDAVTVTSSSMISEVSFSDMSGRTVLSVTGKKYQSENISIQHLPAGRYLVRVKTDSGVYTSKLVKR